MTRGLRAYREVRALSAAAEELARALDRSGTVLGVANWLRWLCIEKRIEAENQLTGLIQRIEEW